jgi:5'-3' exonuclease
MGIKGLRDLLKKQSFTYENKVPMRDYEFKKIVIDAPFFICMYKAARKELYDDAFIQLFTCLLENNIHPTFVFDGKSPSEKNEEKKKRNEKKKSSTERIAKLHEDLEIFHKTGEISDDLQSINNKARLTQIVLKGKSDIFSPNNVKKYIDKLENNILNVTAEDFTNVKLWLSMFGIPWITAPGEAEIFCAALVKKGIADAVMTKDTDVLACCVPIMIFDVDIYKKEFTEIKLDTILSGLDLNEDSWLDLCIMCGTDFNSNIPRVGPITSLAYIKKYKNIETIAENVTKLDVSILSHVKTRALYQCDDLPEKLEIETKPDFEKIEENIRHKKLKTTLSTIKRRLGIFDTFNDLDEYP